MNKLKFHLIHYIDVFKDVGIIPNEAHITEYLNGQRQDILENFDIFTENVRSKNRTMKNFNLFERTPIITNDCIIVIGFYTELLEFWDQRKRIYDMVKFYCNKFPNNKVVITWNHDIDAAHVFNFMDEFKNLYILNYNTSVNHERYILLPFWTIDDELLIEGKKYLGNLICYYNNSVRSNLRTSFIGNSEFFISEKVDFNQYKKLLSSSKFTLCPKGLGLSSYRFFECFHLNTIPILFADNIILPYLDRLNYDDFTIRIPESASSDGEYILNKIKSSDYEKLINNLNLVRENFTLKGVQEEIYRKLI